LQYTFQYKIKMGAKRIIISLAKISRTYMTINFKKHTHTHPSDLEIRLQSPRKSLLEEHIAIRDFAHEQLNAAKELVDFCTESLGAMGRSFSDSLHQTRVRLGVVKLNTLQTTKIVIVSRKLEVGCSLGE
jgi:hypothetical protein